MASAWPTSEGKQQFGDSQWSQDIHPCKSKEITADKSSLSTLGLGNYISASQNEVLLEGNERGHKEEV